MKTKIKTYEFIDCCCRKSWAAFQIFRSPEFHEIALFATAFTRELAVLLLKKKKQKLIEELMEHSNHSLLIEKWLGMSVAIGMQMDEMIRRGYTKQARMQELRACTLVDCANELRDAMTLSK